MDIIMPYRATALRVALFASLAAMPAAAQESANRYAKTVFVANKARYAPQLAREPKMVNAWGIAIRPKGAGGHFWVTAKDVSYEYVGDVTASPDASLHALFQDKLKTITLPVGGDDKFATGVVFSNSTNDFVITQEVGGAAPITAPAKFFFASDGGVVSAWTERKLPGGGFDRPGQAIAVIDQSKDGAQFFGITISHDYDHLYVADFGAHPAIKTFDGDFEMESLAFDMPFDDNKNGKVDAGEYAPFNVQAFTTPGGDEHVFVTYAKTQSCPKAEIKKGSCKAGEIFAGEEDTSQPGQGKLAEFTESGSLVAVWNDAGKLSAPWGMAFAPAHFGALSGMLLVGNFGDGSIAAFDAKTHDFVDVLRDSKGKPVKIDKLWGLLFGNGESLGDANSLYYAAGPRDEKDGVFGRLRPVGE